MPDREVDTSGPDSPIETVGNHDLVASDRVEGTAIYDLARQKTGHVHNFMVNKRSGTVDHVIVADGGFFGFGAARYMAIPWNDLTYDPDLGGYVTHITKELMETKGRVSATDAEMQIW
jgi:sporulation protein YlmC with PRC-barrel domain